MQIERASARQHPLFVRAHWAKPCFNAADIPSRTGTHFERSAMTTIKATCPCCGEVSLTADGVLLRIGATKDVNRYGFTCPACGDFVEKPADERIVRLLLSGGVVPVPVHVPAEVLELREGPPITYDDVLDFHENLQHDH